VSAKDLGTGKSQNIVITASSGLSKDEVEKMRRDAESHAEEDKARREEVELRNEADNTVYRSEKFVKDNSDKLGAAKSGIESAVASVKDSLKGSDSAAIRSALDKLNETLQTASAGMYQKEPGAAGTEQASSGPGGSGSSAGGESKAGDQGPIIDAEVVDEKKKA
jgi:molecular chaperone DnaK